MKPPNYNTVCPYLMVAAIEPQIEFLLAVFDGKVKEALKNGDGIIMHGEVTIGDTVIMMGRGSADLTMQAYMNYVFVEDVNQVYKNAKSAGAISKFEPTDRFYGIKEAGFQDLNGNIWFAAQPIKEVSVEEMKKGFANKKA